MTIRGILSFAAALGFAASTVQAQARPNPAENRCAPKAPAQANWRPFQKPFVAAADEKDAALLACARGIHDRVLTLDTHVDINAGNFNPESANNYGTGVARNQVDLVKMEQGGLDAAFLIAYVGQGQLTDSGFARAHEQAIEKFEAVHRLVNTIAPDRVGLALTAADARRIYASGKKVVFIGIENGFQVGTDINNVKKFYDLGGRYMSLAHNRHSQLSDSNTGESDGVWLHNGLSPLGRDVIKQMNSLGIMIDVSHPSKLSMMQTLELTRAPIIGSHSAARALCNHSRNMDDEQLQALKRNGGVIQAVAFRTYVKCGVPADSALAAAADRAREADLNALRAQFGITATEQAARTAQIQALAEQRQNDFLERQQQINDRIYPGDPRPSVSDFVDHVDYVARLIGVDHVGISSDFDGGGGVVGWQNATQTFNVTLELARRGYSEEEIGKIWSGNLLRVLGEVEKVAQQMQQDEQQAAANAAPTKGRR